MGPSLSSSQPDMHIVGERSSNVRSDLCTGLSSLLSTCNNSAVQLAKQAANVDVAVDAAALRNWLYHCRQASVRCTCGPAAVQAMRALLMGRSWSFLHLRVVTYTTPAFDLEGKG